MRRARALALLAGAMAAALPLAAGALSAEEVRGKVELLARGGKGPARGSDVRQAVATFEPEAPAPVKPPAAPFEVVTRRKEFLPRVLAVPRGSRVRFPNQDPILHNVFSVSPDNAFDLGLYRKGPGKEARFDRPGLVRVFCNVHHGMIAYVLVLATPFSASPAADGSFVLTGLPKGPGKLTVWHEQAEPWTASLRLPLPEGSPPLAARLEVVRPLIPPHLNKTGKSYFASGRDRYAQP
jgi:plastocyanin